MIEETKGKHKSKIKTVDYANISDHFSHVKKNEDFNWGVQWQMKN